jgi:hypothetical protein
MTNFNWNLTDEELELNAESVEQPVDDEPTGKYIAVKGINHKGLDLRVEPGEIVPDVLHDVKAFDMWIKDGAIKKVGE